MACAVLLVLFNKAALSGYDFEQPNVITLLQLVMSLVILTILAAAKKVTLREAPPARRIELPRSPLPRVSPLLKHVANVRLEDNPFPSGAQILRAAPVAALYLVYMIVGMVSLKGVNLPMYTTLRRTTTVFTMAAERLIAGKRHGAKVVGCVVVVVVGALVAGLHDLDFDLKAYLWVFSANVATAAYLAGIAHFGARSGLTSFGLMWVNSLLCVPPLLVGTIATGEARAALAFRAAGDAGFRATLAGSCALAFALNYAIFLNTRVNSALAQTVSGNLKDVVLIGVGLFTFGGVRWEPWNALGMALGLAGSVAYAYVKIASIKS